MLIGIPVSLLLLATLNSVATMRVRKREDGKSCCFPLKRAWLADERTVVRYFDFNSGEWSESSQSLQVLTVSDGLVTYVASGPDSLDVNVKTPTSVAYFTYSASMNCFWKTELPQANALGQTCLPLRFSGKEEKEGKSFNAFRQSSSKSPSITVFATQDDSGNCIPFLEEENYTAEGMSVQRTATYRHMEFGADQAKLLEPPSNECVEEEYVGEE